MTSLSCVRLFVISWIYSPWNSPGQNTGVGSLSLLQGIFPTQGSNLGLPHCRQIFYQLSHKGSPRILERVAYPFSSGSSQPKNWTGVSCIAGRFFTNWTIREAGCKLTSTHMLLWAIFFCLMWDAHNRCWQDKESSFSNSGKAFACRISIEWISRIAMGWIVSFPKFICWSPNPQYAECVFADWIFKEVVKLAVTNGERKMERGKIGVWD